MLAVAVMTTAGVALPGASAMASSTDEKAIELATKLNVKKPGKVWGKFTPAERKLAMRALTPATVEVTDGFGNKRVCPDDGSDLGCVEALPGADADSELPETTGSAADVLGSGCRSPRRRPGRVYHALAGNRLFGYFLDAYWCWNGGKVTPRSSYRAAAYPEVYFLVWSYAGAIKEATVTTWGPNDTSVYAARAGKFKLCIAFKSVGCVQHKNPRITLMVYGKGYTWDTTG